jgi:acylpyruvate hydrolase
VKLVTFSHDGHASAGRLDGDVVTPLDFEDVGAVLRSGPDWRDRCASASGAGLEVADVRLLPTITAPSKVVCLGLNYLRHVREGGREVPEFPTLFAKFADSLCGPDDEIVLPSGSTSVDWEAELVVVIGSTVRDADEGAAIAAIAGYAVGNDVSMRDWQRRTPQWLQGKAWERSTPVGPLVTADEVGGDGRPDLAVTCTIDGELMQDARTSDLLFDCVDSIRYVSTIVSLRPGDLIFTGTPAGVGMARDPQVWIKSGQVMVTEIERIGRITNRFS